MLLFSISGNFNPVQMHIALSCTEQQSKFSLSQRPGSVATWNTASFVGTPLIHISVDLVYKYNLTYPETLHTSLRALCLCPSLSSPAAKSIGAIEGLWNGRISNTFLVSFQGRLFKSRACVFWKEIGKWDLGTLEKLSEKSTYPSTAGKWKG